MRSLQRRIRARRDDGFTIVEMLVVMVVMTVILAAAYNVLLVILKNTKAVNDRADASMQVRHALAQIERQVVSGNVLYDPATEPLPMSMRVYTQANGLQRCVQWQVTGGELRTRAWAPGDSTASPWTVVARHIVNTSSQQPFVLQGGSTAYGSRLVDVRLFAQLDPDGGPPAELETSISGRNTLYGYDPDVCQVPTG